MSRAFSTAFKNAVFNPETDTVFLCLVEFNHPSFGTTYYFVANNEDIISNGQTYTAFSMLISLPSEENSSMPEAQIIVDNVDRRLIEFFSSISTPATLTMNIVLSSDPDTVELGPLEFELFNVRYDQNQLSASLSVVNYLEDEIGAYALSSDLFPGLHEWDR
jgi:hypothetical protein